MESWSERDVKVKLLYVEDDPFSMTLVPSALSKKYPQMEVHTADNGEAGLRLYQELSPDIILTDICMPQMDGVVMAKNILAANPSAKIIAATAISDTQFMLDAIKIGISRYVVKPFDFQLLFRALDDILKQIVLERKVRAQNAFIRQLTRAIDQSPGMVVITDGDGGIQYVNTRFSTVTGFAADEVIGENFRARLVAGTPPDTLEELWGQVSSGSEWHGEVVTRKKGGENFSRHLQISPLTGEDGSVTSVVAVIEDSCDGERPHPQPRPLHDNPEG